MFSALSLPKQTQKLFIFIPETCFTFLRGIRMYFFSQTLFCPCFLLCWNVCTETFLHIWNFQKFIACSNRNSVGMGLLRSHSVYDFKSVSLSFLVTFTFKFWCDILTRSLLFTHIQTYLQLKKTDLFKYKWHLNL